MKVHLLSKQGYGPPGVYPKEGKIEEIHLREMPASAVPRVEDWVEVFRGWSSSTVERVLWLASGDVNVYIGPDLTGEYAAYVAKTDEKDR